MLTSIADIGGSDRIAAQFRLIPFTAGDTVPAGASAFADFVGTLCRTFLWDITSVTMDAVVSRSKKLQSVCPDLSSYRRSVLPDIFTGFRQIEASIQSLFNEKSFFIGHVLVHVVTLPF